MRLSKLYQSEFDADFVRDFLDPNYKGEKYLFGTNDAAAQVAKFVQISGFINNRDKISEFRGKSVINDVSVLNADALVLSCVHLGAAAAADIFLSAFSFRHLSVFSFSKALKYGGGGGEVR